MGCADRRSTAFISLTLRSPLWSASKDSKISSSSLPAVTSPGPLAAAWASKLISLSGMPISFAICVLKTSFPMRPLLLPASSHLVTVSFVLIFILPAGCTGGGGGIDAGGRACAVSLALRGCMWEGVRSQLGSGRGGLGRGGSGRGGSVAC